MSLHVLINENLKAFDGSPWKLETLNIHELYPDLEALTLRFGGFCEPGYLSTAKLSKLRAEGKLFDFTVKDAPSVSTKDVVNARECKQLKIFICHPKHDFSDYPIETLNLKHILDQCKQLKSLRIQGFGFTDAGLESIAQLKTLEKLTIYCQVQYTKIGYSRVVENCSQLKRLKIQCSPMVDYEFMQKIPALLPQLEMIDLGAFCHVPRRYSEEFSEKELEPVIRALPKLTKIKRLDCSYETEQTLRKTFPDITINGLKGRDIQPITWRSLLSGEGIDLFDD